MRKAIPLAIAWLAVCILTDRIDAQSGVSDPTVNEALTALNGGVPLLAAQLSACSPENRIHIFSDLGIVAVWDPQQLSVNESLLREVGAGLRSAVSYLHERGVDNTPSVVMLSDILISSSRQTQGTGICGQAVIGTTPDPDVPGSLSVTAGHELIHALMGYAPMAFIEIFGRDFELSIGRDAMTQQNRDRFWGSFVNGNSPFNFGERGYSFGGFETYIMNRTGLSLIVFTMSYAQEHLSSDGSIDWSSYLKEAASAGIALDNLFHDFTYELLIGAQGYMPPLNINDFPFADVSSPGEIYIPATRNFSIGIFPLYSPTPRAVTLIPPENVQISIALASTDNNSQQLFLPSEVSPNYDDLIIRNGDGSITLDDRIFRPPFISSYRPVVVSTLATLTEHSMDDMGNLSLDPTGPRAISILAES